MHHRAVRKHDVIHKTKICIRRRQQRIELPRPQATCTKIWRSLAVWFMRYESEQTDKRIYSSQYIAPIPEAKLQKLRPGKVGVDHSNFFGAAQQRWHIKQPQRFLKITHSTTNNNTEWARSFQPQLTLVINYQQKLHSVQNDI